MIDVNKARTNPKAPTKFLAADSKKKPAATSTKRPGTLAAIKADPASGAAAGKGTRIAGTTGSFVSGLRSSLPWKDRFQSKRTSALGGGNSVASTRPGKSLAGNSVRAANKNFFLVPEFKDPDFLKDEFELALAQVSPPPEGHTKTPAGKQEQQHDNTGVFCVLDGEGGADRENNIKHDKGLLKEARGVYGRLHANNSKYTRDDSSNNNNNTTTTTTNNNNSSKTNNSSVSEATPQRRNSTSSGKAASSGARQTGGHGKFESPGASLANGMRRTAGGTVSHHQQATSGHQQYQPQPHHHNSQPHASAAKATAGNGTTVPTTVEIVFNQGKPLPKTPKTSHANLVAGLPSALPTAKTTSTAHNSRPVKPLVHRHSSFSNRQGAATATVTTNNNSPGLRSLSSSTNNNMNHQSHRSFDHEEEIKYIDSDDTPGSMLEPKHLSRSERGNCLPPPLVPLSVGTATAKASADKARVRPKSTILCSATNNHNVFEKVNNYKFTNGSGAVSAAGSTESVSALSAARQRQVGGTCAPPIDSSGIKASIEKFNSFSEMKRLPLTSTVIMRSSNGSGSTSNLQHHRHSGSDFDNCNLRMPTNASGSLTRSPYRTTSAGKVITSMHQTPAAAVTATRPISVANHSTSPAGSINSNSLPSKSSSASARHGHDLLIPTLSRAMTAERGTEAASSLPTSTTTLTQFKGVSNSNSSSSDAVAEDSIRSTTTGRSVLPPPSPTSSRYWDRDSSRTTSSQSSSTTANNSDLDEVSKTSDGKNEGLCGLRNIGNTCFMNSVIQCLSHTTELTKFLRSHNGSRTSASKDQAILFEFAKLIREMWTNNVHSVTPMELKRAFSTKHRMYSDYNQQDAQEFLRFFLDSLHGALNSGIKGEVLKIDDNLSDNKKAELTWEWYTRHENSLIRDLFVGQLKSTLRCTTCGNTSVTFDPFWDLSVSLPSSSRCKLEACLDLFIKEEVLDGDEMPTCSKCQTRRKCTKSFTIQRFPKYLVIHLKRFSETRWSKMSNIVEFPTGERELNMGPYGSNRTSMYYSLYAISNHMGSTAGGHYVALCKHPVSKKWHEFNDNIVSDSLGESQLVSSSAYILFYERV